MKFVNLILKRIVKVVATRRQILRLNAPNTKFDFGWRSALSRCWAHIAPGPSIMRGGKGERRDGEGRKGNGKEGGRVEVGPPVLFFGKSDTRSYRDGLPTYRRSPIQVLTGPDVE